MAILKTWLSAYILNAAFYILFPGMGVEMAALVAVFSFPASLLSIPVLYFFWSVFSQEPYHKAYIILWSCMAAIVIALICSIGTIGVITHDLTAGTLSEYSPVIIIPAVAAVLSILMNHQSIYRHTQGHHHVAQN